MAYKNNIPQPGNRIASSQNDILNNFSEVDTFVKVDHIELNSANQGKHNKTTLVAQGVDPVTAGNEVALFSKNGTDGNPQLFYRAHSSGVVQEMTYKNTANPGYTVLPSGIIMHYGSATLAAGKIFDTFLLAAALPNAILSTQATPMGYFPAGDSRDIVIAVSPSGLNGIYVRRHKDFIGHACPFNFLVIGW